MGLTYEIKGTISQWHHQNFPMMLPRLPLGESPWSFPGKPAVRGCQFGDGCRRGNPSHFVEESHPGDPDFQALVQDDIVYFGPSSVWCFSV